MALRCFDHAFALADDSNLADVWYNIGQVAIGMAGTGSPAASIHVKLYFDF